jgi:hypothetical protein
MTLVADSDSGPSRAYGGLFWYWLLVATRAKSRFSEVSRAALDCFLPSDGQPEVICCSVGSVPINDRSHRNCPRDEIRRVRADVVVGAVSIGSF